MTGSDIKTYVENRLGTTEDASDIIEAVNEAINTIGDMSLLYGTITITVTDSATWYDMPSDFTSIKHVLVEAEDNDELELYFNWEYRSDGSIKFFDEETFTIVARKMATEITDITDTISIHRLYENAIKYYALAWCKENYNFEDAAAQMFYGRFERAVTRAANTLLGTKPATSVTVIRHA